MSERDFLLQIDEEIGKVHDQCPDDETRERLWEVICTIAEQIRRLNQQMREEARGT